MNVYKRTERMLSKAELAAIENADIVYSRHFGLRPLRGIPPPPPLLPGRNIPPPLPRCQSPSACVPRMGDFTLPRSLLPPRRLPGNPPPSPPRVREHVSDPFVAIDETKDIACSADDAACCTICYERKKHVVLVPCGHRVCGHCANHLKTGNTGVICPICRARGTTWVWMYD